MSGRLIVKLNKEISPGQIVIDNEGNKIGKIIELIGSVKSPYASVDIFGNNGEFTKKKYINGLKVFYNKDNQFSIKRKDYKQRKFRSDKKTR